MSVEHWERAYSSRGLEGVSWYEGTPTASLELVDALGVAREDPVVDVGGGGSLFADGLVARGFTDVTVLDLSQVALDAT